jgi:hypothetical protein
VPTQQVRIRALEAQVTVPPVRVNEPSGEPPTPPPAAARRAFVKLSRPPTQIVEHIVEACLDCGTPRSGGEGVRRRQVRPIPRVRVEVIRHAGPVAPGAPPFLISSPALDGHV